MRLNIEALKKLMQEQYGGNYNAFARDTGVNVALLYRMLNDQAQAGLKTINTLIEFFKAKELKVEDYIFLP